MLTIICTNEDDCYVPWIVPLSKNTHIMVCSFLEQRGMKKDDLSCFIKKAVKWRVLDQTIAETRSRFEDVAPDEIDALIAEAVAATRQSAG